MKNRKKAFYKRKTVIAAGALCLVSVFGLAGVYRMESAKNKEDQQLVNWEEMDADIREAEENQDVSRLEAKEDSSEERLELSERDREDGQKQRLDQSDETTAVPIESVVPEIDDEEVAEDTQETSTEETQQDETAQASVQNAISLSFKPEMGMLWPVEGNVITDYSMDQSIYFPTLDQYKYSPAIAIQSEVGTPVIAVAAGVIDSIVETDETGLTMTVDLGDGYQAVYGQLADITLSTGSYVEAGSQIATVAAPSIYYQVEGDNLYFQVLKDGEPQDPLDYMK